MAGVQAWLDFEGVVCVWGTPSEVSPGPRASLQPVLANEYDYGLCAKIKSVGAGRGTGWRAYQVICRVGPQNPEPLWARQKKESPKLQPGLLQLQT